MAGRQTNRATPRLSVRDKVRAAGLQPRTIAGQIAPTDAGRRANNRPLAPLDIFAKPIVISNPVLICVGPIGVGWDVNRQITRCTVIPPLLVVLQT